MKKKAQTAFVCNACGADFSKWHGKCPECGAWETVTEFRVSRAKGAAREPINTARAEAIALPDIKTDLLHARIKSTIPELDRVLGGGAVPGALVLVGGDPGIGKSTLLLQVCASWAAQDLLCMYVSGEESAEQISMRALRLNIRNNPLKVLTETSVESIIDSLNTIKPHVVVIDSIQTVFSEAIESAPGSVSQVRESAAMLLRYAKTSRTTIFLIGHVTKDGTLAGPRMLEHMVDTVLYFEGDRTYQYRLLRAIKNRYGPSGEIAIFSMSDCGLQEVVNASELFLQHHAEVQTGSAVVPIIEGSRVLAVELQALVNHTHFGLPQRVAAGINPKKLSLLLAVMERHSGVMLGDHDIFVNVAGGLAIAEPAADLATAAAILSSFRNRPLRQGLACIGEIGLGGEVRPVNNVSARLRELQRLGFSECIIPRASTKNDPQLSALTIQKHPCGKIAELADILF